MANFFIYQLIFLFASEINSLKVWLPSTDIKNVLNWDKKDTPKDCDYIHFQPQSEVTIYWNIENVAISGLSLPAAGDIVLKNNLRIVFRNKEKCSQIRDLNYIRRQVKGWLDPDNWNSDSKNKWLPHVERVPCAGEDILFPPQKTFAVQLPSILVPIGNITFDSEVFRGDTWADFLKTDLGYELFKGADDLRSLPWRNDVGCSNNKCTCGRSSYTILDGYYRDIEPRIYEEAVCLYAMPKCGPSDCYSPVVPEGHCCGICDIYHRFKNMREYCIKNKIESHRFVGAVIKIEDKTGKGLNLNTIKKKVEEELEEIQYENYLKTYVGRTRDKNIQIVVLGDGADETLKSHAFAKIIERKLNGQKLEASITSRFSGLRFSNYLFNSVSGVVFGTFIAVVILFGALFYIYVILPKKKFGPAGGNPFMFARFDNTVAEENLEIGIEPGPSEELPQAFDNPMYSGNTDPKKETQELSSGVNVKHTASEIPKTSEGATTKEYSNPVYSELEKTKQDEFQDSPQNNEDEFSEIKF